MKVKITVTLNKKSFISTYETSNETPEYKIADDAFRVALLFAETQVFATFGHAISGYEFGKFIENLDYKYEILEGGDQ